MSKTIAESFEYQAEATPEHLAVLYNGYGLTYRELNERANQLARVLKSRNVGRETVVGIMAERSVGTVVGIIAILKAGGCYMPIATDYPSERISYMLRESKANTLLIQRDIEGDIAFTGEFIDLTDESLYTEDKSNLEAVNSMSDLAYVIFTSGTTGKPKGAMIEHRNVLNLVNGLSEAIYEKYTEKLNIALVAPFTFDASIKQLFPCLLLGHTLIIVPEDTRLDGKELVSFFRNYRIDVTDGTPAHLKMLLSTEAAIERLSVKHYIIGGEALTKDVAQEFLDKFTVKPRITNVYGPTECSDVTTFFTIEWEHLDKIDAIPIGRPIENAHIYIIKEDNCRAETGESGELYIGGAGVGRGYLNREELTRERFQDNPFIAGDRMYKTGDRVRLLEDGYLYYIGRNDNQIKIRGFRIEPEEIECEIQRTELVKEAAVIARDGKNNEKYLCAYYVRKKECSTQQIRERLEKSLPYFMLPSFYIEMNKLPLTANGKLDKTLLPEPDATAGIMEGYAAPENEIETKLANMWEQILGVERVGVKDDFFVLGGHSLRANILAAKIEKVFNVRISIRTIFKIPTIRELAACIRRSGKTSCSRIEPVKYDEYYELSPAQRWIFMSHYLAGGDISWNMPGLMLIEGQLDKNRFTEAFTMLVKRHETMRTSFELLDNIPVQRIHDEAGLEVIASVCGEDQLESLLKDFIKPFDLTKTPLIRAALLEISEVRHALLFDMHHIVFDGVSVNILVTELLSLYRGEELPKLKIQYRDYAHWMNAMLMSDEYKNHEKYWLETLSGDIPKLDFPCDYGRMGAESTDGDRIVSMLGTELSGCVRRLAAENRATLFMVLLAAYNVLLYKYTGQKDFITGTFAAGRPVADLEKLIGMFVNTVVMRNFPDGSKTFKTFLCEVKENSLKAYEHQDYPFEEILPKLRIKREQGKNPVFDTMLILQNFESTKFCTEGLEFIQQDINLKVSPLDMIMEARELEDDIKFTFTYKTSLFKRDTAHKIVNDYFNILKTAADNSNLEIDKFAAGIVKSELENVFDDTVDFNF